MGDQARQSQELELWPMMGSSGNVQARRGNPRRSGMQGRGNISDYRAGATPRTGSQRAGSAARTRNSGNMGQIRRIDSNAPRSSDRRRVPGRVETARTGTPRTARAARPVCAEPNKYRTGSPGKKSGRQVSKKKVRRRARMAQSFAVMWIMAMAVVVIFMGKIFLQNMQEEPVIAKDYKTEQVPVEETPVVDNIKKPAIREDFLTISEYNRPGTELASVKNIFVHYTANQGTSAAQNRSYFESLGQTHERAASAHFIIGYEGEIVQCIPLEEEAYAVVEHNGDSISIECCYLEKDGSFTQKTYDSLIEMLVWLTDKYDLEPKDILRHYDCSGKKCPLYYVEHEDEWQKLLEDVANYKQ